MWPDFVMYMTQPRIGWLSISGMCAIALFGVALVAALGGLRSEAALVFSGVVNATALWLDFRRNG